MTEILRYVLNMLPYMLCALPVILLWRGIRVSGLRSKGVRTTLWHEAGLLVFALFLVGLASQTVIPKLEFDGGAVRILSGGASGINLIPLRVFYDTYYEVFVQGNFEYFLINFLGNVVMFLPIGFLIPLLWNKKSLRTAALAGFCCSLFIELAQIPQPRGTDVDDLWLNTLGAVLGWVVFAAVQKAAPAFTGRFCLNHSKR